MPGLYDLPIVLVFMAGSAASVQAPSLEQADAAPLLEGEGRAVIRCDVTAEYQLANCELVSEEPVGCGYGQAGLRMSKVFKLRPKAANGADSAGTKVTIPIKFSKEAGPPFGWQASCPIKPSTPAARPPAEPRRR